MMRYPVTVSVCLAVMVAISLVGRRAGRNSRTERWLRAVAVWGSLAALVVYNSWYLWPSHYDGTESWPLHLCDVAAVVAPLALWSGRRWLRAVLYFWAFALSSQAFITPVIDVGPDRMHYWLFWVNHTQVLALALYDLVVLGYRPTLGDVWRAIGVTGLWFVGVLTIDWMTGWAWNYGYVGPGSLARPTLLDVLGPWPQRLVWLGLLVIGGFHLLWLPWGLWRRERADRSQPEQSAIVIQQGIRGDGVEDGGHQGQ